MAREYPRFSISKTFPQSKTQGYFLHHNLTPKCICKIVILNNSELIIQEVKGEELIDEKLIDDMYNWLFAQVKLKNFPF